MSRKRRRLAWSTLSGVLDFHSHVVVNGMHGYFSNRGDDEQTAVTQAFSRVDKKLTTAVKNAFKQFAKNKDKHDASHAERDSKFKEYDIVPAGKAPGHYESEDGEDEDDYEQVENALLSASSRYTLMKKLAKYIRDCTTEFDQLPQGECLSGCHPGKKHTSDATRDCHNMTMNGRTQFAH